MAVSGITLKMKNLAPLLASMPKLNRRQTLLGLCSASLVAPNSAVAQLGSLLNAKDLGLIDNSSAEQSVILQGLINSAADVGLPLFIPSGIYNVSGISLPSNISIFGISGATILKAADSKTVFNCQNGANINIKDIDIDGAKAGSKNLIHFTNCQNITLNNIGLKNSSGNGAFLEKCQGEISSCAISNIKLAAIHLQDSLGMIVSANHIKNCNNGGILVWRYNRGRDGSVITDNQIASIGSESGNGQNGNGVNIFNADEVIIANNSITDCAFSAVRANTTNNTIIKGNICTQCQEVAIFSEFAFSGSIIADNIIDQAATGISITNFDDGGRLAVCSGNIVRNIWKSSPTNPDTYPVAIFVEADTAVSGNVIENVPGLGIYAGWGVYLRDVLVSNNVVRNTMIGIGVSMVEGAGIAHISDNVITGSKVAAISGMSWLEPKGSDLIEKPDQFSNVKIMSNTKN